MCLFELLGDYAHTCIGDTCEESNINTESCDVYVWGSNSSHQLAEGTHEKILTPKLTRAFNSVQQVSSSIFSLDEIHLYINDL